MRIVPKNKAISNFDLISLCRQNNIQLNGIFAKDEMETLKVGNYIINLNNHDEAGSHWIALVCAPSQCCYFDSFGAPPPQIIEELMRKYYTKVNFNNFIIQSMQSQMCGYYCLGLLLWLKKASKQRNTLIFKVNSFVNLFEDNTIKNNAHLVKFFKNN